MKGKKKYSHSHSQLIHLVQSTTSDNVSSLGGRGGEVLKANTTNPKIFHGTNKSCKRQLKKTKKPQNCEKIYMHMTTAFKNEVFLILEISSNHIKYLFSQAMEIKTSVKSIKLP